MREKALVGKPVFCRQLIAKGHHAVVHVDIFHNSIRVLQRDIIMPEVPKRAHSQRIEIIGYLFYVFLWYAENRHGRAVFLIESANLPIRKYLLPANLLAHHLGGVVEHAYKPEAQLLKGHVPGNSLPQVARTYQNTGIFMLQAQDFLNGSAQLGYMIAIALLPETAKPIPPRRVK